MKKRWFLAALILALIFSCLSPACLANESYSQEAVERELQTLMAKYCGTYWRDNFLGAIQCKGFADMVFHELYGTRGPGPYSDSKYELPEAEGRSCIELGVLSPAESNYGSLKALLSQALPGDYVQCVRSTGTQHSMIVVETSSYGITFFDCNLRGSLLCASYTYTWEEVSTYLTRGISLYRHEGYVPTEEYRLYFDPMGGSCDIEYKPVIVGKPYGTLPVPEREGYLFDHWYFEEFNSTQTPTQYPVTHASVKTAYSHTYLKAQWRADEGPCATLGHSWGTPEQIAPTCTLEGCTRERCAVCGEQRDLNVVPATGHSYKLTASVPATNVDDGKESYLCSLCGHSYEEVILSLFSKFEDLDENAWYYSYVRNMVSDALMNGVSETSFAPNATLTRAMLVTILYRMQGQPEAAPANFTDVPQGAWFEQAVAWASEYGVVTGYPDGSFRPNAPITREQAATILYRYAPILGRDNSHRVSLGEYADRAEISTYALEAMEWDRACEILSGFPDNTLRPRGMAQRVQIAKMLDTFLQNTEPDVGIG